MASNVGTWAGRSGHELAPAIAVRCFANMVTTNKRRQQTISHCPTSRRCEHPGSQAKNQGPSHGPREPPGRQGGGRRGANEGQERAGKQSVERGKRKEAGPRSKEPAGLGLRVQDRARAQAGRRGTARDRALPQVQQRTRETGTPRSVHKGRSLRALRSPRDCNPCALPV